MPVSHSQRHSDRLSRSKTDSSAKAGSPPPKPRRTKTEPTSQEDDKLHQSFFPSFEEAMNSKKIEVLPHKKQIPPETQEQILPETREQIISKQVDELEAQLYWRLKVKEIERCKAELVNAQQKVADAKKHKKGVSNAEAESRVISEKLATLKKELKELKRPAAEYEDCADNSPSTVQKVASVKSTSATKAKHHSPERKHHSPASKHPKASSGKSTKLVSGNSDERRRSSRHAVVVS